MQTVTKQKQTFLERHMMFLDGCAELLPQEGFVKNSGGMAGCDGSRYICEWCSSADNYSLADTVYPTLAGNALMLSSSLATSPSFSDAIKAILLVTNT